MGDLLRRTTGKFDEGYGRHMSDYDLEIRDNLQQTRVLFAPRR